jgi:hypothetical protein
MRFAFLGTALLVTSCLNTTPLVAAPADLDGNLHWFWVNGSGTVTDAEFVDASQKLNVASKASTRAKATENRGELTRLASSELGVMLPTSVDPSAARGVFLLNVFDCTLDALERSIIALDQKAQRPDSFHSYSRVYSSDADAYRARTASTLSWNVDVTVDLPFPISETYRSLLKGDIRRVESSPLGPLLVVRTWLTAPAEFQGSSTSAFTQDYQIEVFWERSPGEIFHAYGIWRQMKLASVNLGTEDAAYVNIMLDNLKAWDTTSSAICKKQP